MAVCKMEMVAVGTVGRDVGLEGVCGRRETVVACAKLQRVMVSARLQSTKRWPSVVSSRVGHVQPFRLRCNATDNADPPKKDYDVNEVVEKVVHDEKKQLSPEEKGSPEPLPEGEPSPFSPADENTDDPFAEEPQLHQGGEKIYKDSLIMPSKAAATTSESAASSSIGEGGCEQSTLSADPLKSGGRDWRVHGMNDVFENAGGNSVDDYKLRAHIFSENATAVKKKRESSSVV